MTQKHEQNWPNPTNVTAPNQSALSTNKQACSSFFAQNLLTFGELIFAFVATSFSHVLTVALFAPVSHMYYIHDSLHLTHTFIQLQHRKHNLHLQVHHSKRKQLHQQKPLHRTPILKSLRHHCKHYNNSTSDKARNWRQSSENWSHRDKKQRRFSRSCRQYKKNCPLPQLNAQCWSKNLQPHRISSP